MANKKSKATGKKRKFHGNRFSKNESQEPSCHSNNVTSAKKLKLSKEQIQDLDSDDTKRISDAVRKDSANGKLRRKKLRSIKKGFIDTDRDKEGAESYSTGKY